MTVSPTLKCWFIGADGADVAVVPSVVELAGTLDVAVLGELP